MRFATLLLLLSLTAAPVVTRAQPTCPALVEATLAALARVCATVDDATVCAAHPTVMTATDAGAITTVAPGETLALTDVGQVMTTPADPVTGGWGAARVTLAVDAARATLLLLGDATLSNAAAGSDFAAAQVTTGLDTSACTDAPNLLALSSPPAAPLALTLNGAALQLTGLAFVQWGTTNSLTITVIDGELQIPDALATPAGATIAGVMDNTGAVLFWSQPRLSYDDERATADLVARAFAALSSAPPDPSADPTPALRADSTCTDVIHTVAPGEFLNRIADRYGVTVAAIVEANRIDDRDLVYPGQQLVIPCGGPPDTGDLGIIGD